MTGIEAKRVNEQERLSFCFGPFRLDVAERLVSRDGQPVTLPPKAFETLLVLVQNSGRLVTKQDLMQQLWPDAFVEEANLANNISLLRKALDDDRQNSKYIETVPKSGYRFIAKVTEVTVAAATSPTDKVVIPTSSHTTTKRWLAVGVGCLVLAVAAGYYFFVARVPSRTPEAPSSTIKSLAVLPFKPLVESTRDEFLELGIADTLITRLSKLRQLNVRPMGAVLRYAGVQVEPGTVGREQQVDAVLDGNIQKADNKIRVSVRLVRVADGVTLWADQFDENYADIFTVQDAISSRVGEVLISKLSSEEMQALHRRDTQDVEAYRLFMTGRYFWSKFTREGLEKSITYYNQALERDPNYAAVYLALSASYVVLGVNYLPPKEVMPKAKEYLLTALEHDVSPADAHFARAVMEYFYEWDWVAAESDFRRALEIGPTEAASAHQIYAYYLWANKRFDEGIAQMKESQNLDPSSLQVNEDLGVAYYYARKFDEAIQQQNKTIDLDANYFFGYQRRGQAYLQKSMYKEAIDDLIKARTLSGNWPSAVAELGCGYALAHQESKARAILNELKERAKKEYIDPYLIALVHTSLGENDAALEWLTKGFEARSPWMAWVNVEPKFDRLRSDPRFADLIQKMRLPQ